MYAVIRRYQFDPSSSEEIDRKVRGGFVPLLRRTPGFVAYYWLDSGEGAGASLSVFKNQAGADESVRIAADFVQRELATLVGTPEILKGEIRALATQPPKQKSVTQPPKRKSGARKPHRPAKTKKRR
jgi:hypothetical protein